MVVRHLYLFAYDISDGRRRRLVRAELRAYAVGGQKSLFECWLRQGELADLCARLPLMLGVGDRLHVVRLSESVRPLFYGCAKSMVFSPFVVA